MNRLAWDKKWRKEFPWSGHIWENENNEAWVMDNVSSVKDLRAAYTLVCNASKRIPESAYRLFMEDSEKAFCGHGLRFALAPKGVQANIIWSAPKEVEVRQSYAPDLLR